MLQLGTSRIIITDVGHTCLRRKPISDCEIVDELFAKVQYWQSNNEEYLWIGLDECSIRTDKIKLLYPIISEATSIPIENILSFCVHNHSSHDYDSLSAEKLAKKIIEGLNEAKQNLANVTQIRETIGYNPFIFNRRANIDGDINGYCVMYNDDCIIDKKNVSLDPFDQIKAFAIKNNDELINREQYYMNEPVDHRIHMWEFLSENDTPVGINIRVNTHPCIVSQGRVGLKISGDYVHALETLIEEKYDCLCSTFNGAFGNTRPINDEYSFDERDKFALEYFNALIQGESKIQFIDSIDRQLHKEVPLPLREDIPLDTQQLKARLHEIDSLRENNLKRKRLNDEYEVINSFLLDENNRHNKVIENDDIKNKCVHYDLGFWQLGPMKIFALPGEPFVELAKEIEQNSGYLPIGLCNGYLSYLPHPSKMDEGGYEINQDFLSKEGLQKLIDLKP